MAENFLSRIMWQETLVFMLIRPAFGTIGLALIILASNPGFFSDPQNIIMLPVGMLMCAGIALGAGWLSQVGVPLAGIISLGCSVPMFIGDPMVWVLKKLKPEWVPVDEPGIFNPPLVWVMKT